MGIILLDGWKQTKDIYSLSNDQKMKNIDNLISPSGKVVSVFLIEEEPKVGLFMFDKMFRDYKEITTNLKLLIAGKIKIKDSMISTYIIKEQLSKKLMAHMFYEKEDKLYCLIFNLEKTEKSLKALISSNHVLKEAIKLVEMNI